MSKIDIIEKLQKIIDMQARNGRTDILVHTDDLEKLGMTSFENKGMVVIELEKLEMLMEKYEQQAPQMILNRRDEDRWEK